MTANLPTWAMRTAKPEDRLETNNAFEKGTIQSNWDTIDSFKPWAFAQGWATPWFNFKNRFFETMLENDTNFALALAESELIIRIPKSSFTFSDAALHELDEAYEKQEWGWLVESLREIRRAIEAGVSVHIDGKTFKSNGSFF